jgi:2-polyprenyl-6-methoxyphenol hydroxylase-like FAD-dependent oxidoreductase
MNRTEHYDVVVVGGRVAGASTALLLARAGVRVVVLERTTAGSDTLSTHALMRAGVLQLSRWGLLPAVLTAGTPAVRRTLFHHEDGDVSVSIRPSAGVDALYAPRRHVVDAIIASAAAEAGAELRHGTVVTELVKDADGRVLGVRGRDASGGAFEVRGRLTVGADGIGSVVARSVQAPVERQGRSAGALLYRYVGGLPAEGYEWAYGARAAAGLVPTNGGQACVFVEASPPRVRRMRRQHGPGAFEHLLREVSLEMHERIGAGEAVGGVRAWGGVPGRLRRSWGPGWALVGDAGYFKDPITTHGMTDALRDAELLVRALVPVLTTGGDHVEELEALRRYQRQRDALSHELFGVTDEVARFDWDSARIRSLLRRVSSAMSDEVDLLSGLPSMDSAREVA